MNAKLLSAVAVMAMCLVSCAVIVDSDESSATVGETVDGITDLGFYNAYLDDDPSEFNDSDSTHVYTGVFLASFDLIGLDGGSHFYVAKNSVISIVNPYDKGAAHGISIMVGKGYNVESISIPVDYYYHDFQDDNNWLYWTNQELIEFVCSEVGSDYKLTFSDYQGGEFEMTITVIDTPFDVNDNVIYFQLGSMSLYGDANASSPYKVHSGLLNDTFNLYDSTAIGWNVYVDLGTEIDFSNDYESISSIDSGSGITVTSSRVYGVCDTVGSFTITDVDGYQCELVVIDTNPVVEVSSVEITGQNTVSVGSQITLTAVTGPSDATDRGVEWSIVSGESFISRISTTDTATGGTITIQGVSDGVATVRATATDGSGVYKDYQVTVSTPQIVIESEQGDVTITSAMQFLYTVDTNVSGCTVLVSGADWLSVNGNTVSGTPSSTGDYTVTLTVTKSGYLAASETFTIKVVSPLGFSNEPSTGVIVYEV